MFKVVDKFDLRQQKANLHSILLNKVVIPLIFINYSSLVNMFQTYGMATADQVERFSKKWGEIHEAL